MNQYAIDYIEENYGESIRPVKHKPMKKLWMPKGRNRVLEPAESASDKEKKKR